MTDTAHIVAEPNIDWTASDCVPLDIATLSPDERQALDEQYFEIEKDRLRALALHQRLAARGLAEEADVLGIQWLYGNVPIGAHKAERLAALETIVAQLECGAVPGLLDAIANGAGTSAALRLLSAVQAPDNAAGFGERVAVAVICKADDDAAALRMAGDVLDHTRDALAIAAESLRSRLEVVETAIARLDSVTVAPLQ